MKEGWYVRKHRPPIKGSRQLVTATKLKEMPEVITQAEYDQLENDPRGDLRRCYKKDGQSPGMFKKQKNPPQSKGKELVTKAEFQGLKREISEEEYDQLGALHRNFYGPA